MNYICIYVYTYNIYTCIYIYIESTHISFIIPTPTHNSRYSIDNWSAIGLLSSDSHDVPMPRRRWLDLKVPRRSILRGKRKGSWLSYGNFHHGISN